MDKRLIPLFTLVLFGFAFIVGYQSCKVHMERTLAPMLQEMKSDLAGCQAYADYLEVKIIDSDPYQKADFWNLVIQDLNDRGYVIPTEVIK